MRTPLQDNQEISVAERALTLWGDTVYRVALGQTGSRAEAEDIYQDVFLKIADSPRQRSTASWNNMHRLSASSGPLPTPALSYKRCLRRKGRRMPRKAAAPKRAPQPLVRREPSVHCGVLVARPDTLWLLPVPLFSS